MDEGRGRGCLGSLMEGLFMFNICVSGHLSKFSSLIDSGESHRKPETMRPRSSPRCSVSSTQAASAFGYLDRSLGNDSFAYRAQQSVACCSPPGTAVVRRDSYAVDLWTAGHGPNSRSCQAQLRHMPLPQHTSCQPPTRMVRSAYSTHHTSACR
jgi:hypothetical protein